MFTFHIDSKEKFRHFKNLRKKAKSGHATNNRHSSNYLLAPMWQSAFGGNLKTGPKNPEIIQHYLCLISLFDETTEKYIFPPKKGTYLPNRTKGKRA